MAEKLKDKMEEAGHKISETAAKVGHKVEEKVEEAADWAKETAHKAGNRMSEASEAVANRAKETFGSHNPTGMESDIREHMDVVASCGTKVGKVDHVVGSAIKLTKNDSPDGMHHMIPLSWVTGVDSRVHLSKDHLEVQGSWQPA